MQVQIVKSNGQTDTVFNVTDVHVNHEDNVLTLFFNHALRNIVISFNKDEWTNFITSH